MTNPSAEHLLQQADGCLETGHMAEALSLYEQACQLEPGNGEAWMMRGALLGEAGQLPQAVECLQHALDIDPGMGEAQHILGRLLAATGRPEEAARHLRAALQTSPEDGDAWCLLAAIEGQLSHFSESAEAGRKAVALQPDSVEAHVNLANALRESDELETAILHYRKAVERAPSLADAWKGWASACSELGRSDEALQGFRKVLVLQPGDPDAVAGEACVLAQRGDFDAAWQRVAPLVDSGRANADIALLYASLSRRHGRSEQAVALLEAQLSNPGLAAGLQSRIHFALGKLHDAASEYDRAFRHFEQANRLRTAADFDPGAQQRLVEALTSIYNETFVRTLPGAVNADERPLFIVGMPRSGTTLVEQVLASHPDVYGAGELWDIALSAQRLHTTLGDPRHYPLCVPALDAATASELAQAYLDRLSALGGNAARVTDKMPHNFIHLGLIAQLFPRARIIHCTRNPLDTCLSCYFSDFQRKHEYSNDLGALAGYYRLYRQLMDHWNRVLDIPMLEVRYEDLVREQETVSREIVAFAALPWDDGCLDFHATARTVVTLSYEQVRQPIYSTSIDRWRHYEPHIGPLQSGLNQGISD